MQSFNYNMTWQTPMIQSLFNWNNSNAGIEFNFDSASSNTITAEPRCQAWYGINITTYNSNGELLNFDIILNSRTISRDCTNTSNFIQSVFVHELGHCIWLADNPNTTRTSIMKYSRDRDMMTLPQSYDVEQVSAKY